jgi:hypothetical protein
MLKTLINILTAVDQTSTLSQDSIKKLKLAITNTKEKVRTVLLTGTETLITLIKTI